MSVSIYILKDPVTGDVRYVGKTIRPSIRISNHVSPRDRRTHVAAWVRSLHDRGLRPVMEIIEVREDWEEAEKYWIAEYRRRGADLTNITIGGEYGNAMRGIPRNDEVRAKISATQKGRVISMEHRRKISDGLTGKSLSDDTKRKISEALKGRAKPPRSKDHGDRISVARRGHKWTEEAKAKLREIRRAYASSERGKANIAKALQSAFAARGLTKKHDGILR